MFLLKIFFIFFLSLSKAQIPMEKSDLTFDDFFDAIGWTWSQSLPELVGKSFVIGVDIELDLENPFFTESSKNCIVNGAVYSLVKDCRFGDLKTEDQCVLHVRGSKKQVIPAGEIRGEIVSVKGKRGFNLYSDNFSFMNLEIKLYDDPARDWNINSITCRLGKPGKFPLYAYPYTLDNFMFTWVSSIAVE